MTTLAREIAQIAVARVLSGKAGILTRVAASVVLRDTTQHPRQDAFIQSRAKRKIIRAGRRGGKTVGVAKLAVLAFLAGIRVLYATPTSEQLDKFWREVKQALRAAIDSKLLYKNETEHILEVANTEHRIRAKTAWNADTMRGDHAGLLIFDEWQHMNEDAWGVVGAPMLLDNNGDAVFVYTPPSLRSRSVTKANDPQHATKMFRRAKALEDEAAANGTVSSWATFHFSSKDNPTLTDEALDEVARDMSSLAYRMEILAEDVDEAPGALWTRQLLEDTRVLKAPELVRVVVAIDPSASSTGDEAGIITAGKDAAKAGYIVSDDSVQGSPKTWATAAVTAYHKYKADAIVAEANNGGEMISEVIAAIDPTLKVKLVHASRGKQTRAEPVAALYEQGRVHHVGSFPKLEDEQALWVPGDASPNRMDAAVWAITDLLINAPAPFQLIALDW